MPHPWHDVTPGEIYQRTLQQSLRFLRGTVIFDGTPCYCSKVLNPIKTSRGLFDESIRN
jgi:hypothetical protein